MSHFQKQTKTYGVSKNAIHKHAKSGVISAIQAQKKNKTRFSIFVDEEFSLGVSDSALTRFNLRKGTQLSKALIAEIQRYEERWAIREYCIGLLSRRDHSSGELLLKAQKKGYDRSTIEDIILELEQKKYINNVSFARKFAKDKFEFNHWGLHKIRVELMAKGISDSVISSVCLELDEESIVQKMRYLVQKAKPRFLRASPEKRKKKIFDFLVRKGYDSAVISKHLSDFIAIVNS
jgi:regulatory protein